MKKIAAKAPLLLAGVAVLLLAWAFAGASNGGEQEAGVAADEVVHASGEARPPAGYPFSDPQHYWPVRVYTSSEEVLQLVTSQALPAMTYIPSTVLAMGAFGFRAWVPEPLIVLLEQHPDVERVGWGRDDGSSEEDQQAGIPEDKIVTTLGSDRPPAGYPFSDPRHYRGVYIYTSSKAVRELVASQALPRSHVYSGMVYGGKFLALTQYGFAAWVPEPLIPVLEAHPEVERLEWDSSKMPLVHAA